MATSSLTYQMQQLMLHPLIRSGRSVSSSSSSSSSNSSRVCAILQTRGYSLTSSCWNTNNNNHDGKNKKPVSNFSLRRPPSATGGGPISPLSSYWNEQQKQQQQQQQQQQGGQQQQQMQQMQQGGGGAMMMRNSNTFVLRPNAIELFPGNYDDDEDYEDGSDDGDDDDIVSNVASEEDVLEDERATLAEKVQRMEYEKWKQRDKWIENSKPIVRVPQIDDKTGRSYGRGGRKTASARVWIQPGYGHIVVNKKDYIDYFDREAHREHILEPLVATKTCGFFDVICMVQGGGLSGKAGAIRHGLARALNNYNPQLYRPPLKELGYLTRDPRKVERKKIGHKKARKKKQWAKR